MPLVLRGTVVTMDHPNAGQGRVLADGCVYIRDDGIIDSVLDASAARPAGFAGVARVQTGGVIWPGLIDLHSHSGYNLLPLWEAPGVPYRDHDQWTNENDGYHAKVLWPSRAVLAGAPEAALNYLEVKALIGGTTTLQGAPKASREIRGWLTRMIDVEKFGTETDRVRVSTLQKSKDSLLKDAVSLETNKLVLIYHVGEGTKIPKLREEFALLAHTGVAGKRLIGVHATALTAEDYERWPGGAVVWSPFSNLWLYGMTTDVVTADQHGLRICLGSDWSPSGTKHVLGELKVADICNRDLFNNHFSDPELCAMVTRNSGDALAEAEHRYRLGRLEAGAMADITVVRSQAANPYRGLIDSRERDIRLVMVGGAPRYGLPHLMTACGAKDTNVIRIAGSKRQVVTKLPGMADKQLSWRQSLTQLRKVSANPADAVNHALAALAAFRGSLDDPDAPLLLFGDMPEPDGGLLAGTTDFPPDTVVPPPDTLVHDDAFFAACQRRNDPQLVQLRGYYQ